MSRPLSFDAPAKDAKPVKKPVFGAMMRKLWPYIWPADRRDLQLRIYASLVLLLAGKVTTIAVPYAFKWATDALTLSLSHPVPGLLAAPVALTLLYGSLRIVMALFTQLRDAIFAAVAMHAVRRLARDVFEHLHMLSLRFHLERKTGGLTRVLERGRNSIETIVRTTMLTAIPTSIEFALILIVLFVQFDWRFAAVVVAMIIAYMVFTTLATNWRITIRRKMNESDSDANTKAIDSLLNFETVKYFNAEVREMLRYDKSIARYERMSVETYTSLAFLNGGQAIIFALGLTCVMAMSAAGIKSGVNTVGDFVFVNAMMIQLYQPLSFMGLVYREIKQSAIDLEMMFDILNKNPEIEDRPGAAPLALTDTALRFENVFFHYDPRREILRGVSFEVPAGKTVALVGASGAGKSTISRLIFRFYEPSSGRITIGGQDIAGVTQASLRAAIGIVPQDTVLFNDSIAYNIFYGRDGASEDEMKAAARLAQIDHFIESAPGGYEAQVGERGLKLSGGEKQRVAIARAILKGPPILILDEATSALDSLTEREIQTALDRVARGRTTLVIAHRLSTIVNADEILVLDKGRIIERGSHAALLAQGGAYAAMWSRQNEIMQAEETLRRAALEEGGRLSIRLSGEPPDRDDATFWQDREAQGDRREEAARADDM
ncbi:ABCB family ABC transporter ATP-binding protein/permease [Methylocapsa palsarum]